MPSTAARAAGIFMPVITAVAAKSGSFPGGSWITIGGVRKRPQPVCDTAVSCRPPDAHIGATPATHQAACACTTPPPPPPSSPPLLQATPPAPSWAPT
jgi:hypothetical protein